MSESNDNHEELTKERIETAVKLCQRYFKMPNIPEPTEEQVYDLLAFLRMQQGLAALREAAAKGVFIHFMERDQGGAPE